MPDVGVNNVISGESGLPDTSLLLRSQVERIRPRCFVVSLVASHQLLKNIALPVNQACQ